MPNSESPKKNTVVEPHEASWGPTVIAPNLWQQMQQVAHFAIAPMLLLLCGFVVWIAGTILLAINLLSHALLITCLSLVIGPGALFVAAFLAWRLLRAYTGRRITFDSDRLVCQHWFGMRTVPYDAVDRVHHIALWGMEVVHIHTRDGSKLAIMARYWPLEAILDELHLRVLPRITKRLREQIRVNAAVEFQTPRSYFVMLTIAATIAYSYVLYCFLSSDAPMTWLRVGTFVITGIAYVGWIWWVIKIVQAPGIRLSPDGISIPGHSREPEVPYSEFEALDVTPRQIILHTPRWSSPLRIRSMVADYDSLLILLDERLPSESESDRLS